MTLKDKARGLVEVLRSVCAALDGYDADDRADYARRLARELHPLVDGFEHAVLVLKSRETAQGFLADIQPIMEVVNAAATKGDMGIFKDDVLNQYWDLQTIFRENRFFGEGI